MRFCAAKRITISAPDPQHNKTTIPKPKRSQSFGGGWAIAIILGVVGDRIDGDAFSLREKRILRIIWFLEPYR
jgi:hypothetical protein